MLVKAACTEGSVFNPIEDDHYITFYQDSRCSELSLVFEETPEEDVDVEVWMMDDSGGVIYHDFVKWHKNKHILRIEDIDIVVKYVSIKLDTTFTLHQLLGSNPYHSRKIQIFLFLAGSIFTCAVVYLILAKHGTAPFEKLVENIKENKSSCVTFLFVVAGVLVISIGLSFLFGLVLVRAELSLNDYPISLNYRFIILFSTLFSYIMLTVIYRKKIVRHFLIFTFLTIVFIGFSFVMTESCAIGISWDDQIHYDWINYLSHFADKKRTYPEWEMVDSYGKYPWYKEKVADFYTYFDEYYKEGYFYLLEDFEFPYGKDCISPHDSWFYVCKRFRNMLSCELLLCKNV